MMFVNIRFHTRHFETFVELKTHDAARSVCHVLISINHNWLTYLHKVTLHSFKKKLIKVVNVCCVK